MTSIHVAAAGPLVREPPGGRYLPLVAAFRAHIKAG
jgi:hypothetical protein